MRLANYMVAFNRAMIQLAEHVQATDAAFLQLRDAMTCGMRPPVDNPLTLDMEQVVEQIAAASGADLGSTRQRLVQLLREPIDYTRLVGAVVPLFPCTGRPALKLLAPPKLQLPLADSDTVR